jgi:hypothetical protein
MKVAVGANMLRITRLADTPTPCLRVEGRLVGDSVQVLEGAVSSALELGSLGLDLLGVEFADARALRLLQQITKRGVALVACSPLLVGLLGGNEQ